MDASMAGQGTTGASGADDGSGDTGEDSGGVTIEITLNADGSGTVDVESAADESAEDQGGGGEGPGEDTGGTPFKNTKECLQIVKDILDNGGQVAGAANQGAAQSGFNSVFDSGSP